MIVCIYSVIMDHACSFIVLFFWTFVLYIFEWDNILYFWKKKNVSKFLCVLSEGICFYMVSLKRGWPTKGLCGRDGSGISVSLHSLQVHGGVLALVPMHLLLTGDSRGKKKRKILKINFRVVDDFFPHPSSSSLGFPVRLRALV